MWILGTVSENMPNYLKALKIHLSHLYVCMWLDLHIASSKQWLKTVLIWESTLPINEILSLHYFVVENGYFSLSLKNRLMFNTGAPNQMALIPQQAVFVSYCEEQWNVLLAPREQRPGVSRKYSTMHRTAPHNKASSSSKISIVLRKACLTYNGFNF